MSCRIVGTVWKQVNWLKNSIQLFFCSKLKPRPYDGEELRVNQKRKVDRGNGKSNQVRNTNWEDARVSLQCVLN